MGLRKLVSFDFVNIGAAVNVRGREYDDFEQYFHKSNSRIAFFTP